MTKFPAHGTYHVERQGNVVVSRLGGEWNLEMMREAGTIFMPVLEDAHTHNKAWGILSIHNDSLMTSPESMAMAKEYCDTITALPGFTAIAWVIPSTAVGAGLLTQRYLNLFAPFVPRAVFETEAEARPWLEAELAKHQKAG